MTTARATPGEVCGWPNSDCECILPPHDDREHRCEHGPWTSPDFDRDDQALAWARAKVERVIAKMRRFEARAMNTDPEQWRKFGNMLHREFVGGAGCPTSAFDPRLPERLAMLDRARPARGDNTDGTEWPGVQPPTAKGAYVHRGGAS